MAESVTTRPSLLLRLRDAGDKEAWRQFVRLYAPLVYGFGRKRGLQEADAADLVQDVLLQVANAAGRFDYDPKRGSFRSWLFQVIRHRLNNFRRAQRQQPAGSGDSRLQELLEQQPLREESTLWDREYEQHLLAWAIQQVRGEFEESSWQAFRQTAFEGRPPKEVAQSLGMSVGAVYIAKSRITARLTQHIRQVED